MSYKSISKVAISFLILTFCSCEGGSDQSSPIFSAQFEDTEVGIYSESDLNAAWESPQWNRGISQNRVSILSNESSYSGNYMRILYPKGTVRMGDGGAGWRTGIGSYDAINFSYRIRFKEGFDFVRGGKLPGLGGGESNTGGKRPTGDGWSVRFMWLDDAKMSAYVYHMDQPQIYGEHFIASSRITTGQWLHLRMRVVMNTPGLRDGSVTGWLDGEKVIYAYGIRFRNRESVTIDQILFETFFGGNDASYASTRNEYIDFDEFLLWQ